ncbi:MAG: hypothetical protein AB7V48_04240 [Sedimentibacter sp.]
MDNENILANLVRIGTVSSVDNEKRTARVMFKDKDMISGQLYVLQRPKAGVFIIPDGEHTHSISDTYTGGGAASIEPNHNHMGTHVTYWMPRINDTVVVLYLPVFNGDGFILGAI